MIDVVIVCLIALAALVLLSRDLLHSILYLSVFSLLSALLFFFYHAPDVALTEAAVGAGLSTFIYVWVVRHTRRKEER